MIVLKKVGDYVVYRKEVCKVKEIKEKYLNNQDYYRLVPVDDDSLHLDVPVNNAMYLRDLITKKQVEEIINKIPKIQSISLEDKMLEAEYKNLMNSNSLEDYIKIIKTTYQRNQERLDNKKKISETDNHYFNLAEKYLYNEFSVVLNKTYEETKQYVIDKVMAIEN